MEPITVQSVIAVLVPIAGLGAWLIRLEGRINVLEALHVKMAEDLAYIRARIDRTLNGA